MGASVIRLIPRSRRKQLSNDLAKDNHISYGMRASVALPPISFPYLLCLFSFESAGLLPFIYSLFPLYFCYTKEGLNSILQFP